MNQIADTDCCVRVFGNFSIDRAVLVETQTLILWTPLDATRELRSALGESIQEALA